MFLFTQNRSGCTVVPKTDKGLPTPKGKIKTPFVMYCEDCKENGKSGDAKALRKAYDEFSLQEKYKWVLKAVSAAPEVCSIYFFVGGHNKKEQMH